MAHLEHTAAAPADDCKNSFLMHPVATTGEHAMLVDGPGAKNEGPALRLGLTPAEAEGRLLEFGKNRISADKPMTWRHILLGAVVHPFNFLLCGLATVAGATGDFTTLTVMLLMVVVSIALRFWQELKSNMEAESLKKLVHNKACVLRRTSPQSQRTDLRDIILDPNELIANLLAETEAMEINVEDIVPGDIVKLGAGDMVPGDVCLLQSKDLFISQSALTGEAMPVEKNVADDSLRNLINYHHQHHREYTHHLFSDEITAAIDDKFLAEAKKRPRKNAHDHGHDHEEQEGGHNDAENENDAHALKVLSTKNKSDVEILSSPPDASDCAQQTSTALAATISADSAENATKVARHQPSIWTRINRLFSFRNISERKDTENADEDEALLNGSGSNGHLEKCDCCFLGTSVVSGTAIAVVDHTGPNTLFGKVAKQLAKQRPVSAFQVGVQKVSYVLIRFMCVMVPIVFVLNGVLSNDWLQALLFSVAVAVGLVPEMLPMVVNANLAKGAYTMSLERCIVKRVESIMNLGSMNVLCTDKTGTLTQDKVILLRYMSCNGVVAYRVAEFAYLNSAFQSGLRNLLDVAVIQFVENSENSPMTPFVSLGTEGDTMAASSHLQSSATKSDAMDTLVSALPVGLDANQPSAGTSSAIYPPSPPSELINPQQLQQPIDIDVLPMEHLPGLKNTQQQLPSPVGIEATIRKLGAHGNVSLSHLFGHESQEKFTSIKEAADAYRAKFTKVDEIPFDFVRRRMSVLLQKVDTRQTIMICKGAVEEMLQICSYVEDPVTLEDIPLVDDVKARAIQLGQKLNREGLRVIAVAYRLFDFENYSAGSLKVEDEKDLIFLGFTAFLDPPKETTAPAIRELMAKGVEVKVLTGDNEEVCKTICNQVELPINGVITGKEIEQRLRSEKSEDVVATEDAVGVGMETSKQRRDRILDEITRSTTVFAKLTPLQKSDVVASLRRQGNIVGFLGDGINDAAALREADVGISVDTAVDVAKESADVILLEKSLLVLSKGVYIGRLTYGNTIKYIKMAASSNFGNVFSILVASAWLPFLPMTPVQLVTQNLLYDISQIAIPWDNMDEDFLAKPKKWEANDIVWFMLYMGPISSVFDILLFITMWFYFGCTSDEKEDLFHTAWFVEGLITQTFIVHMIRTDKLPFIQSWPSLSMFLMTIIIISIGLAIPYSPLNSFLGMIPLPDEYFIFLVSYITGYAILTQIFKFFYVRVFKKWL